MHKIIGLLTLLVAPFAFAQETIVYNGATMTGSYFSTDTAVLPIDYSVITGDVVLAQALNPNEANQIVTPVSYNFGGALSSSGPGAPCCDVTKNPDLFLFSTQNGKIVGWTISLIQYNGADLQQSLISTQAGDTYSAGQEVPSCGSGTWVYQSSQCSVYTASSSTGGSFVDPPSTKAAPELSGEGAMGTLTLLAGALLVMRGRRM